MPEATRPCLIAEFDGPDALERAVARLEAIGVTRIQSWSPYAVKTVVNRLPESPVPWIMLIAGLAGAGGAYLVEWWCNALDFPIDVGGRPFNAIPAYIPIAFESAVLAASLAGFVSILALSGLPRLYHPMFEVDGFERAAVDRFFLGVDEDPELDDRVRAVLEGSGALRCERIGGAP